MYNILVILDNIYIYLPKVFSFTAALLCELIQRDAISQISTIRKQSCKIFQRNYDHLQ